MSHISIASAAPQGTVPHNTESLRVEELIPDQLRGSSENFISLIKDYYVHLNTEGLPTYETNRIIDEHDIDKVSIKYLDGIQGEIAKNIPNSVVMDRVSLYKKIVQYYTLKGSEESITTFFRLFFDEIIDVSYPKEKLFSLSSGNWTPSNDDFTRTITAASVYGDLSINYNYTPFQLKNGDAVLGAGKIIDITPINLYDTPPNIESLVFDVNSTKNLNSITESWDSVILKDTWRGYFNNGASFNQYEELVHFDGESAYVDFGDIGKHDVPLDTEEHTFVLRVRPRINKENTPIQSLFSLSKDYEQLHSHELFFNKNTGKIGRSFLDTNEPRIASISGSTSYQFSNFIDASSSGLDNLVGDKKEHMNLFHSPMSLKFNGEWKETLISFNGEPIHVHGDSPVLKTLTLDDLRFYNFTGSTFDAPNNIQVGNNIIGEGSSDFSGVNALSEDGNTLAIGAYGNDAGGGNSGHVRVYQLSNSPEQWVQIGSDIDGVETEERSGTDISLSADGTILAIGSPQGSADQVNLPESGKVKIYELSGSTWVQKGTDINGINAYDKSGSSVSLSSDGTRLAIGNNPIVPNSNFRLGLQAGGTILTEDENKIISEGFQASATIGDNTTKVFEYVGTDWVQVGSNIDDLDIDLASGSTVRLSSDGRTVLIGTHCVYGSSLSACVTAYRNAIGSTNWVPIGQKILFPASFDRTKLPISLSNSGTTLAVGILGDGNDINFKGEVEVYSLSNNTWSKVGETIQGERIGDNSGAAVSLNSKGDVIAIGGPNNDDAFDAAGHVRIYQYTENEWTKVGTDIDGIAAFDQSGSSVSLNGTGSRVVIGAEGSNLSGTDKGLVKVHQLAINASISTFLHAEKHPVNAQSRWSIKSATKSVYYTDWYDNGAFASIEPYDLGLKWIKGSKPGDESLPVTAHCDHVQKNADHIFTLHNRGYMSIYYKHNSEFIAWQDITIADKTEYDGERLWDIQDYAVDDIYLAILDKPVNGASRIVVFKANEYNEYVYDQTIALNLPLTHNGSADFTHIKLVKSQLVVGTHTFNDTDIAQIIHVYDMVDGIWSSDQYSSLPNVKLKSVGPKLEFNLNTGVTTGQWQSTNGLSNLVSTNILSDTSLDAGVRFNSSTASSSPLGFNIDSKFSLAIRFNTQDAYTEVSDILTVGNVKLRIASNPVSGNKSLQVVSQEAGKVDYPLFLDNTDTNIILDDNPREIFSDEYFNDEIKTDEWNNLVVEFTVGSLSVNPEEVITGLRYSLNGFKRSKSVDVINIIDDGDDDFQRSPVHNVNSNTLFSVGTNVALSHISFYDKGLTHIEFERIERSLSSEYTSTVTTGINSLLDGGNFEVSENGNIIIKVTSYGINIWEKTLDGWINYYNPLTSITTGTNNYITHSGSRSYSYKFFGNDLLLVNGGLNNAQQYVEAFDTSSSYNRKEHNSQAVVYQIKSQYLTSYSNWKVNETFYPSVEFTQSDSDSFKIGLNYGVDIAIDNDNDTFAISLEPSSVNKILNGPGSLSISSESTTDVKYDIWRKLGDNFIRSIPLIKPVDNFPVVTSYSGRLNDSAVVRILDNVPSYNAILSYPNLIQLAGVLNPLITYTFDIAGNNPGPGYYLQSTEIKSDFVISTAPSNSIYLDTQNILFNEFNVILIRGRADRYNGYVDISFNGTDFERIISGNTLKHLLISPEANFVLGRNIDGYFNGEVSHSQYYTSAVSNATKDKIVEYLNNNVLSFYNIVYTQFGGNTIGANTISSLPESEEAFRFDTLSGHAFNSFWFFEEPTIGTKIKVTADYNNVIDTSKIIYWGDGRINTVLDGAAITHLFTSNYLGKYEDRKGQASSINKIQDSVFWQEFSYNIRSGIRVDDWEQQFVNLVHPAGLRFFASVILLVIRDNHWFGPKQVLFDPETRQNTSILRVEDKFLSPFRTTQPLEDMRWLESLTAPTVAGGYHMPLFQPGWLQGDIRVREFIFEAGLWTKLARSVPGNEAAAKYTYEYNEGNPAEDFEIRVQNLNGEPELSIGDVVYQDDAGSPSQNTGVITNIGPDGTEFSGIIKSVGVASVFVSGEIYTQSYTNTITIKATPLKPKSEVINVYGDDEQDAAYLQQDRSSIDINSEMFMRAVLMAFKYVIPSLVPAAVITKQDYHQNLKFKDSGEISSYLNTRIIDAIADKFTFMNVSAIIKKKNQLSTEDGNRVYLESDSSPYDIGDSGLLIDELFGTWWNNPEDDYDISAPVLINITSFAGPQLVHGSIVYQDIGNNVIIEGLIVGTANGGNSILVGWRGAINTSASPDFVYPSKPELDQLFRAGTIYTIVEQYDSPESAVKTPETTAEVTISN